MTSSAFCDVHPNCAAIIASRTCIVLAFVIAGVIGNGTVLYIYRDRGNKQQQQASRIYIVTMAYLDTFILIILLPQVILYEFQLMPDSVYIYEGGITFACYMFVQVAMVFDRVFAVFTPFKYLPNRDRFNKALLITLVMYILTMFCVQSALLLVSLENADLAKNVIDITLFFVLFAAFLAICCAYPAIALKLWRQKQKIHASTMSTSEQNEANKPREAHIKALRLYAGVLGLFVLSNVPNTCHVFTGIRFLNYFFYTNCIGNPVVYYMFNEKFRNDVNELATKLKHKINLVNGYILIPDLKQDLYQFYTLLERNNLIV